MDKLTKTAGNMWQLRNGDGVTFLSSFLFSALDSLSKLSTFDFATAQATKPLCANLGRQKINRQYE